MLVDRQAFYNPRDILMEVRRKVGEAALRKERIDYLAFVPDGEPTLDINIGEEISLLRKIGIPVAVITNSSLLWQESVREGLLDADFVSLKVDAVSQDLWKHVNRPHKSLSLDIVLDGIKEFAKEFRGTIVSETMLIDGLKYDGWLEEVAEFLKGLKRLDKAYVSIPTRPPAEKWVKPAKEEVLNFAFQIFSEKLGSDRVEFLISYEGNAFAFTGNLEEDLLGITAVHPMRKEALEEFLKKANTNWHIVEKLLEENKLIELEYEGNKYYMRKLPGKY